MTKKGYIMSRQDSLFGHADIIGFGLPEWHVKEIDRNLANKIIKENHYSKKFYNATYIHLGLEVDGKIMGVLQFGYAMNPQSMGAVVKGTKADEYLELNRMWMDDACGKNTESRAIAFSIKYIKRRYPKIKWIQSFADERCGKWGITYQAANFGYHGEHKATFWELDGEVYHNSLMTRDPKLSKAAARVQAGKDRATSYNLRQFRYIYFIDKKATANCLLKKLPYLKHYEGI